MRFRWPSPLHGWRAFAGEVGVIVLGVILALAAEEAISRYNWRQDVAQARDMLRADFIDLLVATGERRAEDRCIRRRLTQLGTLLAAAPAALPALGHIGSPAQRNWRPPSWSSVVASQVATHFPRDEMLAISLMVDQGMEADRQQDREMADWATLFALVGPGRRLDPQEATQLRFALRDAAYRANMLRLITAQADDAVRRLGYLDAADLRKVDRELRKVLAGPNARALCGPIGRPGSNLIDAPYDPGIQGDPLTGLPEPVAAPRGSQP